jgi:hypothetical protein
MRQRFSKIYVYMITITTVFLALYFAFVKPGTI